MIEALMKSKNYFQRNRSDSLLDPFLSNLKTIQDSSFFTYQPRVSILFSLFLGGSWFLFLCFMKHLIPFSFQYGTYILRIPLFSPSMSPIHLILEIKGDKIENKVPSTLGAYSWAGRIGKDKI